MKNQKCTTWNYRPEGTFKATASAFSPRNLCLLDTSWFSCQLLHTLPGFPSNFSAHTEINRQVIGYKGTPMICILISELENEVSIFLPWTDRHKSHCLQSLNTPHQIYRYWCRRERDHFLCHRNLKCKERGEKKVIFGLARGTTQDDCILTHTAQ